MENLLVERSSRYVPSLDGLRAFAVLAVIAYHMKASWAPGGLLGVTMFFVLSGYLITGLLLKEYDKSGTISLSNFWLRRVRRIIPAVVFAVLGTGLLCVLFDHALLTKMRPDVLPTLLFVNNWWQIFHNVSYFAALGEPSPLTHYWSLAIEEQFYLIWPVALLICMKAGVRKDTICKGTIVLAVISALAMVILFNPAGDPSRVYYGTDTRAFSLLIGAALSFIWPYQRFSDEDADQMTPTGKLVLNLAGIGAVVGLLIMIALTNGFAPFIYRGGLVICSLLTALAIAVMVHPASWIGTFFRLRPLVWVGKVSYSMYLWHYPIILVMTPGNMVGDAPLWLRLVQLVVIFAVSAFSYYCVEDPIRKGAIGKWISQLRAGEFTVGSWVGSHAIPVVAAGAFLVVTFGGMAFVPDVSAVNNTAVMSAGSGAGASSSSSAAGGTDAGSSDSAATNDADSHRHDSDAEGKYSPSMISQMHIPYDLLLLGDSVPASLEGYGVFYEEFPYGHIDAVVGRNFGEAPQLLRQYKEAGALGDVLVIALGTNGYVTDAETDELMAEIGNKQRVWFVNTRSHTEFVEESNAAIARCVEKYPNAELIDWHALSGELGEGVFDGDGTHLNIDGCHDYAKMIHGAVDDYLPKHESGDKTREEFIEEHADALDKATSLRDQMKAVLV